MPSNRSSNYPTLDVAEGDFVFKRDDPGSVMFLVQTGSVEVLRDQGEHSRPVAIFERGDFFGEMALFDGGERRYSARARADSRLVKIDSRQLGRLLTRNPEIGVRMIRKLSSRLASAEDALVQCWDTPAFGEDTISPTTRSARLIHLDGENEGQVFPLTRDDNAIGRADPFNSIQPDVDLTEVDTQLSTSRQHARILRRGDTISVVEEQATNGTFVDGRRIPPDRPLQLHGGEVLRFGAVRMLFVFEA